MPPLLDRPALVDGDATRRQFLIGATSLAALLVACGNEAASPPPTAAAGTGFPVTVAHKYGSTTIPAQPQRVVTVGFTDPDYVLALGVEPVAITDWYGDQPDGIWPWARAALGGARPGVMPRPPDDKLNLEPIASFRPDLIIGSYTGMTEQEYGRTTQLAPTVAQSGEHKDYLTPWQVTMRTFGMVFGRSTRAEELLYASPELQRQVEQFELFRNLRGVRDGRYFVIDLPTATALRSPTVLSIPWALDQLGPSLTRVAG